MGTLLWAAVTQLELPPRALLDQFLGSVLALLLIMAAAAAAFIGALLLRWLWRRLRQS
jgi:hypothetical protein